MKENKFLILIIIIVAILVILVGCQKNYLYNEQNISNINSGNNYNSGIESEDDNMRSQQDEIKINLVINDNKFSATLNNNDTVKQLIKRFPMTLNMNEMNSNEKYNFLDFKLKTNSNKPGIINAGDIKLYGNDCLVVFFKSFSTSYSYTDLGKIDNADEFISELKDGNVTITFEIQDQLLN